MPRTAEQNKIFYDKVKEAKEIFDKVKNNFKDSRTRFNYGFVIGDTNNINTINKVLRELKLYDKYKEPIKKQDLPKLKKQNQVLETLNTRSNTTKIMYKKVLDVIGNKDVKVYNTGLRRNQQDVMEIIIKEKMSKEQIEILGTQISKLMGNKNGLIETSVRSDKWYYCGEVNLGSDVKLHDLYDEKIEGSYDQTAFFISASPGQAGGNNNKNDCLYNCLKSYLGEKLLWKTPEDFRKFLNIEPNTKININEMEKIEKKLNIPINVIGNYTYCTKLEKNAKIINLILVHEHYSINTYKVENINIDHKVSKTEKKPLIYNSQTYEAFDGLNKFKLNKQYLSDIYHWDTPYILIKAPEATKAEYDKFIIKADILKKETNNEINLYKTGSDNVSALHLFNNYTKHIDHPPVIQQVESTFINMASQGALIFTTKGYNGQAYKADIKSMYPSIMKSKILFPVKEGELKYITEFGSFFNYGIYRCKITGNTKLFRFNFDNYYTHFDLNSAKNLGLQIDLIIDDKPNFLYYSRDKCLTGFELFGRYVDKLFDLKQRKIPNVKKILNILWGSLCEKYKKDVVHKIGISFDIPCDAKVNFIKPSVINDDQILVSYSKFNNLYKYGWARIMPFLISKGRKIISEIIKPYENICIRCHTDGNIFKEEPKNIKYGDKLGDLVFEGHFKNISINKSGTIKYN